MPLGSAAHIDFQLRHAGELVVFGTQKGYGLLDLASLDTTLETGIRVKGQTHTLVVREGAFTGLTARKPNNIITVAGTAYVILDLGYVGTDGLRRLPVAEAP